MRLEQVDPEEQARRPAAVVREQRQRFVDDRLARSFVARTAVGAARQRIAVDVEAAIQSEASIERKRRDERAGRESLRARSISASVGTSAFTRIPL